MADEEINWDEATKSGNFVDLKDGEMKQLTIKNWKLVEVDKFGKKQIEFVSEVVEEDGEKFPNVIWNGDKADDGKLFTTTSVRLKKKLRPILDGKNPSDIVSMSIMKVGDKFDIQYSVKEVKGE